KQQDDATAGRHLREILEKRGGQEQLLEQCQQVTAGRHLREILEKRGGQEQLLEQCQQVAASLTDEYQPLMWSFYKSHRRALFQLVRSLPISSTTQDQLLIKALHFILVQENRRSLFLPDTLDLLFASEVW